MQSGCLARRHVFPPFCKPPPPPVSPPPATGQRTPAGSAATDFSASPPAFGPATPAHSITTLARGYSNLANAHEHDPLEAPRSHCSRAGDRDSPTNRCAGRRISKHASTAGARNANTGCSLCTPCESGRQNYRTPTCLLIANRRRARTGIAHAARRTQTRVPVGLCLTPGASSAPRHGSPATSLSETACPSRSCRFLGAHCLLCLVLQ